MKWINQNIKLISFVWFLVQGILLLMNEIRCLLELKKIVAPAIFVISICLIVVSLLLFIRNNKIELSVSLLIILYSIVSLLFILWVLLFWGIRLGDWLFLLIPLINIILSAKLKKYYIGQSAAYEKQE